MVVRSPTRSSRGFGATVGARMVDSLDAHAAARTVPGEARAYARLTGGSVAEFS